jgi:hypothetical protein
MGNPSTEERATEALTRVGVAAGSLGIETFWLEAAAKRLGRSPGRYLRTWLDTEVPRLAIRCESPDALELRPGRIRYVELDSVGGEYELVVGTRPFAQDRELIASVPAPALDAIDKILEMLGAGRCDALGRIVGGTAWTMTLVESTGADLALGAARLAAHAGRFGVTPVQAALLQQAHVALGPKGYTVTLTGDRVGMRRDITLEYRDIEWKHVVGLTDALRPGTSSGTALGVFAGAMGSGDTASGMAITYRAGKTAHIRVAIDRNDDGAASG